MAASATPRTEVHIANVPRNVSAKQLANLLQDRNVDIDRCELIRAKTPNGGRRQGGEPIEHSGYGFALLSSTDAFQVLISRVASGEKFVLGGSRLKITPSRHRHDAESRSRANRAPTSNPNAIFSFAGNVKCGVVVDNRFLVAWDVGSTCAAARTVFGVVNFARRYVNFSFYSSTSMGTKFHLNHQMSDVRNLFVVMATDDGSSRAGLVVRCRAGPCLFRERRRKNRSSDGAFVWQRVVEGDAATRVERVTEISSSSNPLAEYQDYLILPNDSIGDDFAGAASFAGYEMGIEERWISVDPLVPVSDVKIPENLSFRVRFQIQVRIGEGILYRELLAQKFYDLLGQMTENDALVALDALRIQATLRKQYPLVDPVGEIETASIRLAAGLANPLLSYNGTSAIEIHRVYVTPLKLIYSGPEVDSPNRILRQYPNHLDHFVRVSFSEEDCHKVMPRPDCQMDIILDRVSSVLRDGLTLAGRRYEFLGMSNSQLRDHGCWFFSPIDDGETTATTADSIRLWMGDFDEIRVVSKYVARMGQCFSSTITTDECYVRDDEFEEIPDVTVRRKGRADEIYVFTDGVGTISPEFAEAIARSTGHVLPPPLNAPSAFQIRFNGCKGVVAVDERMRGGSLKLRVRPSMRKFKSTHNCVEVCQPAVYMAGFVNRQAILLLSCRGVPDKTFLAKQDVIIGNLKRLTNESNTALAFLRRSSYFGSDSAVGRAVAMLQNGFRLADEPFLQLVLNAVRSAHLSDMHLRSRILIHDAACLMGVVDEMQCLQYGQVFVQPFNPHDSTTSPRVVTGSVVVTKSPCFHPGDLLVLKAVDRPQLRHLVNVVVFPAAGPRPHTDEISGSDLDGDLYLTIWDRDLIPRERRYPPMDYGATTQKEKHPIAMNDVYDFFIDYIRNDQLGVIANAHLVQADVNDGGAKSKPCLELARLHSVAVDFPKTGVPAVMRSELRARVYPDFMAKTNRHSYESKKILGKLHRRVREEVTSSTGGVAFADSSSFDESLVLVGHETHLDSARRLRDAYDCELERLMNRYDVRSEGEAITGYVLRLGLRQRRRKMYDARNQLRKEVEELVKKYRARFHFDVEPDSEAATLKASALYVATYQRTDDSPFGTLYSCPWIVYDYLCKLKAATIDSDCESDDGMETPDFSSAPNSDVD